MSPIRSLAYLSLERCFNGLHDVVKLFLHFEDLLNFFRLYCLALGKTVAVRLTFVRDRVVLVLLVQLLTVLTCLAEQANQLLNAFFEGLYVLMGSVVMLGLENTRNVHFFSALHGIFDNTVTHLAG